MTLWPLPEGGAGDEHHGGEAPDLATLTGVRSGKGSYYSAFVRSDERMQRAVRAMDSISRAVVRTVEGPRGLLEEVVRAAGEHLDADWTVLALSDGHLVGARPRLLARDGSGTVHTAPEDLPDRVTEELTQIRSGVTRPSSAVGPWVRVPMTLERRTVGSLSVLVLEPSRWPEADDLSVLRILANQAAVSLHTSEQHHASLSLHRRAQRLHREALAQGRDLQQRTNALAQAEHRLTVLAQRELIDAERHRIARELHDTVAQLVLSAGMAVELARGDAQALPGPDGRRIVEQLEMAKKLSAAATEQLRSSIYALHQHTGDAVAPLPELLRQVVEHHRHHLDVTVRTEGDPLVLPAHVHHELARAVGEAVFNTTTHASATRAIVRIRYRPDKLLVSVADDGDGDPGELRRKLRVEQAGSPDGRHRGLANMDSRLTDLGGALVFRRARLGGVRVELHLPLPLPAATSAYPLPTRPHPTTEEPA